MGDEMGRLRAQAQSIANTTAPRATRYPAVFRDEVVAVARKRRGAGVPMARIARAVGLRPQTLAAWLRHVPSRQSAAPKLRRVAVEVAPARSSAAIVVRAGGVEIEGLAVADVLDLLRALV